MYIYIYIYIYISIYIYIFELKYYLILITTVLFTDVLFVFALYSVCSVVHLFCLLARFGITQCCLVIFGSYECAEVLCHRDMFIGE